MTVCAWCKGKPVLNAAAWVSFSEPRYVPCPLCGQVWHADALAEYELRDELAVKAEHEEQS